MAEKELKDVAEARHNGGKQLKAVTGMVEYGGKTIGSEL